MKTLAATPLCLLVLTLPLAAGEDGSGRKGPLKGLPSAEGPHIAKIKAMGDNSWLNLGVVPDDPEWGVAKGRGWCGRMPFAPDLRGAFLYGEGRHGGTTKRKGKSYYNDDLFFYDVNANRWICVYPGMEVGKYNLKLNEDGFEVNAEGNPVPVAVFVHCYSNLTYDTDRKMFVHMWRPSGYWRKPFPKRVELLNKNIDRVNGHGRLPYNKMTQASPWMYDTAAGHWRRYKTKSKAGGSGHLLYIPYMKRCLLFSQRGTMKYYNPAVNDWETVTPKGQKPPRAGDAASCYDPKRKRVYVAMGAYPKKIKGPKNQNRVFAFDLESSTWIDLKATGELPPIAGGVSGCSSTKLHYDTANDALLFFAFGTDITGSRDSAGVYAYEPEKNEWKRMTKGFAPDWPRGGNHTFYDTALNAFFIYRGGTQGKGPMFVYRYKRAEK